MAATDFYVNDPILTGIITGWSNDKVRYPFVWNIAAPVLPVPKITGQYVKLGKEKMVIPAAAEVEVAMDGVPNFVSFITTSEAYALKRFALGAKSYKDERQDADQIIEYEATMLSLPYEKLELFKEKTIADALSTPGSYNATNRNQLDNSGAGKYRWNNIVNRNPIKNIQTGIDAVRDDIGRSPNSIIFGWESAVLLRDYYRAELLATGYRDPNEIAKQIVDTVTKVLSQNMGLTNIGIGASQYALTTASTSFLNLWGDMVWIGYVNPFPNDKQSQDFARTLRHTGYPYVAPRERINLSDETYALIIRDMYKHHFINWNAGYLIYDTNA